MVAVGNKVRGETKARATAAGKTYSQSETVALVEKAAGGNISAFGELYSIYLDQIYRYVYYQVKDKMAAEDITEDVFVKAWKSIKSCKGKETTFLSWLYRIAHNHMINTLRRENRMVSIEKIESVDFTDPKEEIETKAEYKELLENITYLPENQKQVVILKFITGLDNREIGKIMGKREGAIRVLQMRALNTLREKLGGDRK
jgi:RNA polymerase sigma-70 factor (ECF subfamily)